MELLVFGYYKTELLLEKILGQRRTIDTVNRSVSILIEEMASGKKTKQNKLTEIGPIQPTPREGSSKVSTQPFISLRGQYYRE